MEGVLGRKPRKEMSKENVNREESGSEQEEYDKTFEKSESIECVRVHRWKTSARKNDRIHGKGMAKRQITISTSNERLESSQANKKQRNKTQIYAE